MNRIEREKLIVENMIVIYCRAHHRSGKKEICEDCFDLRDYTHIRLEKCPYGEINPVAENVRSIVISQSIRLKSQK